MATIGTFSCEFLTVQPFAYDGDARSGYSTRAFRLSALLTAAQWAALTAQYETWYASRLTDADTLYSASVGTTVPVTLSANGLTVTALPCWFTEAPTGEQFGAYVQATVTLVDAAQALAVVLRSEERSRQRTEAKIPSTLGTFTLGSCTLALIKVPETYTNLPQMTLTAGGTTLIQGPPNCTKVRELEGWTDAGGWSALQTWIEGRASTRYPSAGSWFPLSAPKASAEVIITGGAKYTRYTVTITVGQVQ